jgi:hypothetical protein
MEVLALLQAIPMSISMQGWQQYTTTARQRPHSSLAQRPKGKGLLAPYGPGRPLSVSGRRRRGPALGHLNLLLASLLSLLFCRVRAAHRCIKAA